MVWLGPIAPCESQTAENLSWLWSEQEVTMEVGWGQRDAKLLAWKMDTEAGSRGMWEPSVVSPLRPPDEEACSHLDFSQGAPGGTSVPQ